MFTPLDGASCSDGLACSTGDICEGGLCVADMSGCKCQPEFPGDAVKLDSVVLGEGGYAGEALDLDDDPSTCAPSTDCEDGYDNSLGALGPLANDALIGALDKGEVMLVLELRSDPQLAVSAYQAKLAKGNKDCDFQTQTCTYVVDSSMVDEDTCEPLVALPATLNGNHLIAGGVNTTFPFVIPLGESKLNVTLHAVRIDATITKGAGGNIVTLSGVLAGAIPKEVLESAIDQVPDGQLPFPKDTIKNLLAVMVENDIDTNSDGSPDAASIGIKISGIDAVIQGLDD